MTQNSHFTLSVIILLQLLQLNCSYVQKKGFFPLGGWSLHDHDLLSLKKIVFFMTEIGTLKVFAIWMAIYLHELNEIQ